jgi:hypothetical protein
MYIDKTYLGLPPGLVKFLARLGSVTSIVLLVLLFQPEMFNPSRDLAR